MCSVLNSSGQTYWHSCIVKQIHQSKTFMFEVIKDYIGYKLGETETHITKHNILCFCQS